MTTFEELYHKLLKATLDGDNLEEFEKNGLEYDPHQLDCLLHPEKHPVIWKFDKCDCPSGEKHDCSVKCEFDAIEVGEEGIKIGDNCIGCSQCIDDCRGNKLVASKDIIPALRAVRAHKGLSYAIIAPAFLGQFSSDVTPGKLRNAMKAIGFDGMVEVALFADILTLKEALEFDKNILKESDYQLTSCCCPMWIAMIRKIYNDLMPHIPAAVSPMIACGRAIKVLHPDALVVFVGPCMAKKAEAREKDLIGDVDYVLTFQEIQDIFEALEIEPAKMEESEKDHSSRAGRIYARTGGVSEAVRATVGRLNPQRDITVHTQQADGVPDCKAMLNDLIDGNSKANFFEGMGCRGGCVGGPKRIISVEEGRDHVNAYGDEATYPTPIDNPYVIELLHRLGFDTVESLLERSDIFTRDFS
ncbi:iron only hydrogenase large subunit-like protein [Mobilisporobacter senegalensis]|uniref:Iron only hydrogenase large subunit-like protein n=1 Tax=Mobilisporobacter senegalensis TaxID=1329262 RepID=A0A3N1XTD6_9FIRM|nr:[Fe-Fe] hydrogenase large subunit C-terminal domain-containing protein [Mobilisporobacter senegalensis]ROR29431.1 iron only hydrogenase large subunit-like protein [Mobilisporobacter senegalensis]